MAETILVVDDDPAVREVLGEGLSQRGYRVLTAPDGIEGLRGPNRSAHASSPVGAFGTSRAPTLLRWPPVGC